MSKTVIKVENLFKEYHLGNIGYGTLREDLSTWWAKVRGKEDPNSLIGHTKTITNKILESHFLALNDVSFEIKEGEAVGIVGKNGAGKSTLLKLLSRITYPTSGSIKVRGRISSLLEVGTGFHPELTGRENIYLNGAILGMKKYEIDKKIDEIIDFSGIEKFIYTPVKRYSSGMYVRLAFAVAAHLESDILILDEVLAVGDAEFQKKCLGKMDDVTRNQGRTILFVSHNMSAVQNLCSKGILLEKGAIQTQGSIDEIFETYNLNTHHQQCIKLDERIDRTGNGQLKFTNIQLINANNQIINSVLPNEKITIRVHFRINKVININNVKINICIDNFYGARIAVISTDNDVNFTTNFNNDFISRGYIDFTFPKINIIPGNYTIVLYSTVNNELSYWIKNDALTFSINEFDYYESGKTSANGHGYIFLDYKIK